MAYDTCTHTHVYTLRRHKCELPDKLRATHSNTNTFMTRNLVLLYCLEEFPLFPFFFSCYWQALAGIISIWMLSSKPMIYVVRQQRCKLSIVTIIENDNAFDVLSLYHLADFGEWNARAWPTVVRAGVKGIWVGWGKEFVEYDCSRVFTTVDTLLPSLNNLWALL